MFGLCVRQGCALASLKHPPLSHGVSPVMRPHGCWRTVNKADYFTACNFYLFLRTYVSLMAGPLITVRNIGIPLRSESLTTKQRKGGRCEPESANFNRNFQVSELDYIV